MRSAQTESGHIVEAFTRLALPNPHVHFVLKVGDRIQYDLPPTTQWNERISAFFGDEIGQALIRIDSDDAEIKVRGYVCDPSVSRGNARMQYLFLNRRHIRDRALQHALGEAYRGLLMVGRHPVCFLQLDMSPQLIDVNVHPTKLEVRFTDSGRVYARLLQTLRHHFLTTDMTMRVGPTAPDPLADTGFAGAVSSTVHALPPAESLHRQTVIDWARSGVDRSSAVAASLPEFTPFPDSRAAFLGQAAGAATIQRAAADIAPWEQEASGTPTAAPETSELTGNDHETAQRVDQAHALPVASHLGFQIHNRYLVTQDEAGMVVIDQHALHERVMYERIREKVLGGDGTLESQRLLVPEPVSLTPAERTVAIDSRELLRRVGIELDEFGGDTILISAYPTMLSRLGPAEALRQSLELLMAAGKQPEPRDLIDSLLHTFACKAAIKAGDRLTPEEITSLLEQRDLYQDTHHCPHGRPTALFFSRDELDRMFGRLGPRGRPVGDPR